MFKKLFVYTQYILPKYLLSILIGALAESRISWIKNLLIKSFIKFYPVDMNEAVISNPYDYPTFNSFFTRQLKSQSRPIVSEKLSIACPCDGTLAQMGKITQNKLFQAKEFYYDLTNLVVNNEDAHYFENGSFATFYLAPHNYHRVHMPLTGSLEKTIFVPGKLFSVNRMTSELIPQLYARNERFISLFDTEAGKMAVILVGAMIVGSIQTVWMKSPARKPKITAESHPDKPVLTKGSELGQFRLGSTVILLFEANKIQFSSLLKLNSNVQYGQLLGNILIN